MKSRGSAGKIQSDANRNTYQIGGITVDFPHKAYGSQLAFMGRVVSTLDRAQRQSHCHALLESPTGTGKTLSILCSTLAWQKCYSSRYSEPVRNDAHNHAGTGGSDPFVHAGGFIPESETLQKSSSQVGTTGQQKERVPPKIYYASRTHTQISQAINEYRKTSYRVPMAVLASRKRYCTNQVICKTEDVNENCKKLLKDEEKGCTEFKNANKVKEHPSIKKGGSYQVHDIEDLVKIGHSVKGCSYFGARSLAAEAHLIFCPYSYVINPLIRKAMEIDLKGHILILDEAHNIEDMAREAASIDISEDTLHRLHNELGELCYSPTNNSATYQPLHEMVQGMISWISRRADDLGYHDFEHYSSCWTGDSAVRELAHSGICLQSFSILEGCAKKAIKDYSEGGTEQACLSGISAATLEGLFCSLSFFFSGGSRHSSDYQLVLQRYGKREDNNAKSWTHTLSLWCLNPGIVFKEMAELSLSIILTSGTLSPMDSFSSELGVQFDVSMEAPHVINAESQLFASVLSRGPQNHRLNASYKTADGYSFQDELGSCLEEIFKVVPGGILVFFSSYKLLEKLQSRWHQTGKWSQLNALKRLFTEPRGAGDFDATLKAYFDSVRGVKNSIYGKIKDRPRGRTLKSFSGMNLKDASNSRGAALLAVFRGKVSEGVNFSDEDARAVVIVGIPFPNIHDLQVGLKKKYNDVFRSSKSLLSGGEWYCQQAFRALNQAAGRCIRHKSDYGAVLFIDERFDEDRNRAYISKWIGHSIKKFASFDMMLDELKPFFHNAKQRETVEMTKIRPQIFPKYGNGILKGRQKKLDKTREERVPDASFSKRSEGCTDLASDHEPGKGCASDVYDQASLTSVSASNFDDVSLEKRLKHDLEAEEASLSVNTRCHKRKAITDFQLSDCARSFSLDVDDDDAAVQGSLDEDSEGILLELKHQERLIKSCALGHADDGDKKVKVWTQLSDYKMENQHPCSLDDDNDDDLRVKCSFEEDPESECLELQPGQTLTNTCSFDSAVDQSGQLSEDHGMEAKQLTRSTDLNIEEQLHLCCVACKNSLGLSENCFLIPCSVILSPKPHLSSFLDNGFPRIHSTQSLPRKENVRIAVADVWNVDRRILRGSISGEYRRPDVWNEEDGCVFRIINCPFCHVTVLGVQIMATDASNAHLLNKVLFFHERLHIKPDTAFKNLDSTCLDQSPLAAQSENRGGQSRNRLKLRLPRIERH